MIIILFRVTPSNGKDLPWGPLACFHIASLVNLFWVIVSDHIFERRQLWLILLALGPALSPWGRQVQVSGELTAGRPGQSGHATTTVQCRRRTQNKVRKEPHWVNGDIRCITEQCLSQDLETGCLNLAVVKFLGVQIFKGDHNILIFQPKTCINSSK